MPQSSPKGNLPPHGNEFARVVSTTYRKSKADVAASATAVYYSSAVNEGGGLLKRIKTHSPTDGSKNTPTVIKGSAARHPFRGRGGRGNEASLQSEMCSHFDPDEIKRLGKRFRKLDLDNSGSLSIDEFMTLPELQQNPLVQRVIDIFDADGNGEVDFKEFIQGVSQFSVKGDKESKLRFAFRIYDMDNDGYISNGELFQVLKMMVGNNLKDTQLQQIVDKTILFADKDEDGKISFQEFCSVVGNTDIHKKMVVDV